MHSCSHALDDPELAEEIIKRIRQVVSVMHRSKIIAQLAVRALIVKHHSSPLLKYVLFSKSGGGGHFWIVLLNIAMCGGPVNCTSKQDIKLIGILKSSVDQEPKVDNLTLAEITNLVAFMAWNALFPLDHVLQDISPAFPVNNIVSQLASELDKDLSNHVVGKLDQLEAIVKSLNLSIPTDIPVSATDLEKFYRLNILLPPTLRWEWAPISGHVEGFITITVSFWIRMINTNRNHHCLILHILYQKLRK